MKPQTQASRDSLVRDENVAIAIHPRIEFVCQALKRDGDLSRRLRQTTAPSQQALVDQVVAARLLALGKAWRAQPAKAVSAWLTRPEWEALWCQIHQFASPPRTPPTVRKSVEWLAQLGGYLTLNGDEPNPVGVWRGLHRLNDLAAMWRLCRGSRVIENGAPI